MPKSLQFGVYIAAVTLSVSGISWAQTEYARDAITAIAPNRHAAFPTGSCTVWANAEGLGVGPSELDGLHGVAFLINPRPVQGEGGPVTFESGVASAKKDSKAPAWMFAAIEKNRAAIEAACAKDSETPILIHKLTAKDKD